jgi:hypothetical protein
MIAVEYEDADWISGYEVDSEGERISRRGKFDQRYHKVHKTAIIRQIEYRQDLTYGTLERIKS